MELRVKTIFRVCERKIMYPCPLMNSASVEVIFIVTQRPDTLRLRLKNKIDLEVV